MVLASTPTRVPTIAERRADVCARTDLVALEGPLVASSGTVDERGVVKSVSVRDTSGREITVDAQTLALVTRDAAFDAAQTREIVRRLWTSGRWDDVVVETTREEGGIGLVFRVTPKREIANVFTPDEGDASALHIAPGTAYDPVALVTSRIAYVTELVRKGHLDAHVSVSSAFGDVEHRTVDVCVHVDRGRLIVLDAIVVRGSAHAAILQPLFETNAHGAPLDLDVLDVNIDRAGAALYDLGLLTNKIEKTIVRSGDEVVVSVDVTDGPIYRYSRIDLRGDLAGPKTEYAPLVTVRPGDVFDRSAVLRVMDGIRALEVAKGHAGAEVEPDATLDEKTHTVALVLAIKHRKP
jgi:outer membrane protein insertion porin family